MFKTAIKPVRVSGTPSFLGDLHPLLRLAGALGFCLVFLLLPDRSCGIVIVKLALIALLGALAGGFKTPGGWPVVLIAFGLFWGIVILLSTAGSYLQDRPYQFDLFKAIAKSFWTVNIIYLFGRTMRDRELIYLARALRLPPNFAAQVNLTLFSWEKLAAEFRKVPAAWASRGITAGLLRRRPRMLIDLLGVVFRRTMAKAAALERALVSRGFSGRLYTLYSPRWDSGDSLGAVFGLLVLVGLIYLGGRQ